MRGATASRVTLSKSRVQQYLRCPRMLWRTVHIGTPRIPGEPESPAIRLGYQVGELARSLWGPGTLIPFGDGPADQLLMTQRAISARKRQPIFEATFQHQGVLVRIDLLLPVRGGWQLVEVKASGSVKDEHLTDCATQLWVARGSGLNIRKVTVAHLDTGWIYRAPEDYRGLLKEEDVTEQAEALQAEVADWVSGALATLAGKEPKIGIGAHCRSPYICEFSEHCGPNPSPFPVHDLPRAGAKADAWYERGLLDLREVPPEELNAGQKRYQAMVIGGKPVVSSELIERVKALGYPRCFIDFETLGLGIPYWLGTRPFEPIPFQWSCHVQSASGAALQHYEFLAEGTALPVERFLRTLVKAVGTKGPVLVFSGFERRILKESAARIPQLRGEIAAISKRLVDILPWFREGYLHPDLGGSWSIKAILPTLGVELRYEDNAVKDGQQAQEAFFESLLTTDDERRKALREGLLAYCQLDTLAMEEAIRAIER